MQNDPRLSGGQRVFLAVAAAAAIAVVARCVCIGWIGDPSGGGWFMYSPDSAITFSGEGRTASAVKEAGVWLVAIALWLALAWRLFKRPGTPSGR